MNTFKIIKQALVTEKGSTMQQNVNQYCFEVASSATKRDVREAVTRIFKVKVAKVRTINMPAKYKRVGRNIGRTSEWKKAIVTLKQGERIELLEGA